MKSTYSGNSLLGTIIPKQLYMPVWLGKETNSDIFTETLAKNKNKNRQFDPHTRVIIRVKRLVTDN